MRAHRRVMPGHRLRVLLAATVAVTVVSGVSAAPRSNAAAHTAQPARGAAVTIKSVTAPTVIDASGGIATVVTTGPVTSVTASTGAAVITFTRSGDSWTARLRPHAPLTAGANTLYVRARSVTRTSNSVARTVYVLGRARNLGLAITDATAAGGAAVSVATRSNVAAMALTVNGKDVSGLLAPDALRQSVALGAGDGLERGRNNIVVTVVQSNGDWQRRRLTYVLDTHLPVAEAGSERSARVGDAVSLDASASSPARLSDRLQYAWQIVRAPLGSHAQLTNAASARPRFIPDLAGTYWFRVTVTGPAGSTSDTVRITSTGYVPPVGALLQTQAVGGGGVLQLNVDGQTVATMPAALAGASMLVIYDRKTLEQVGVVNDVATVGAAQAQAEEVAAINNADSEDANGTLVQGHLAVLSFAAGPAVSAIPAVSALGVTPDALMLSGAPFSLVVLTGTGGDPIVWRTSRDSGTSATEAPGNMRGYLQVSNGGSGPYAPYQYVPDSNTAYDTAATSTATTNTMAFGCPGSGCVSIASAALTTACATPGPLGGFQLVALPAGTLQYTPANTLTVTTNDGCGAPSDKTADENALDAVTSFLAQFPTNVDGSTDYIIAIQSIGQPRPVAPMIQGDWRDFTLAWLRLGQTLVHYGATTTEFANVGSITAQGYTLLGTTAAMLPGSDSPFGKEMSADNPEQSPARLAGLLERNHRYDLTPLVNVDGAGIDSSVGAAVYQPATPWPYSASSGEQHALAYITNTTGPNLDPARQIFVNPSSGGACYNQAAPSFRDAYCNTGLQWAQISTDLAALENTPPTLSGGFTAQDWKNVTTELAKETAEIPNAVSLVSFIQAPFLSADQGVNFAQIVKDIQNSFAPPAVPFHAYGVSTWLSFVGDIAGLAWAVLGGFEAAAASAVAGVVSEVFAIAADFTTRNGRPEVKQPAVTDDAQNLASELAQRYLDSAANIGYLTEILVTDPMKLQMPTDFINKYGIHASDESAAITNLSNSANAWLYSNLLGTLYTPQSLWLPQQGNGKNKPFWRPYQGDASTYLCSGQVPFKSRPTPAQQYMAIEPAPFAGAPPAPVHYVLAAPGSPLAKGNVSIAPAADLAKLFGNPAAAGGGLGMPQSFFWERQLGLPTNTQQSCPPVGQNGASGPTTNGPMGAVASNPNHQTVLAMSKNNVLAFDFSQLTDTWQILPALPAPADAGSPLGVGSAGPGDLHVFFLSNGKVVNYWMTLGTAWRPAQWQGPGPLPATVVPDKGSAFAVTSPGPGSLDLFYVAKGHPVLERYTPSGGFAAQPTTLPGTPDNKGQLAAAYTAAGDEHLFFVVHGLLSNDYLPPGSGSWQGPGGLVGHPDRGAPLAAASYGPGDLHVFFDQQGSLVNSYALNGGPMQGPSTVSILNGQNGVAAAAPVASLPPSTFTSFLNVLFWTSLSDQGWSQGVVLAVQPPVY